VSSAWRSPGCAPASCSSIELATTIARCRENGVRLSLVHLLFHTKLG
jgi:hypothetical protein